MKQIYAIVAALVACIALVSAQAEIQVSSLDPKTETLTLENIGDEGLNMTGFKISDAQGHSYTFGAQVIEPGESLIIISSKGNSSIENSTIYMQMGRPIWNNDGDNCTILDEDGALVAAYEYGKQKAKRTAAPEPVLDLNATENETVEA